MSRKIIIIALGLTCSLQLFGQIERQAIENIWKGKWEKAYYQLDRATSKDTLTVSASYAWAVYFSAIGNPDYALDSASRYIRRSIVLFGYTTDKQRERMRRLPLDSLTLIGLRDQIDSTAFAVARGDGTAAAYEHFIEWHPDARLAAEAIALRDERAYQDALKINRYEAFHEYLLRYPTSTRYRDATLKYEALLYTSYTHNNDLDGYQRFVREHPGTSFQARADQHIFEISTASGDIDSFVKYLATATSATCRKRAMDILFHLLPADRAAYHFPEGFWSDSLQTVRQVAPLYIAPYLHDGKFGFMDPEGNQLLRDVTGDIEDHYLCGNITDNFVRLPSSVVALNGAVIYRGETDDVEDMGLGLLLVSSKGCHQVVHKSGFVVPGGCVDQAKPIANRFIAVQRTGNWHLLTLTGRPLMSRPWDAISFVNQVVVLESFGQRFMSTPQMLAAVAAAPERSVAFVPADRIERWPGGNTRIRMGRNELLLNGASDTAAFVHNGTLRSAGFGVVADHEAGSHTVSLKGVVSGLFRKVHVSGARAIVLTDAGWRLFDPVRTTYLSGTFDSLRWAGPFAIGIKNDSIHLFFRDGVTQRLKGALRTTLIQGSDSVFFILVDPVAGKPGRLYSHAGKLLFPVPYDNIQYAGMGYFRVSRDGKYGLIATDGKVVVPVTMNAIGTLANNTLSVLKDNRFGLFNCMTRKMIPPQYATNLVPYGQRFVVTSKNGLKGIVSWDNKPVLKNEFEEVRFWNDTAAFVRNKMKWSLLGLRDNTVFLDHVRDFRFLGDGPGDQIAIVHVDDNFGVLHSRKGTIIPLTFTDIVNLGSADVPLFFTEKHIAEASVYVVIYYDSQGRFLRKEVHSAEEYERIYCANN